MGGPHLFKYVDNVNGRIVTAVEGNRLVRGIES